MPYKLAYTVAALYDIACGKDLKKFLLVHNNHLLCYLYMKNHVTIVPVPRYRRVLQSSNLRVTIRI
jgi:hypothetical protein